MPVWFLYAPLIGTNLEATVSKTRDRCSTPYSQRYLFFNSAGQFWTRVNDCELPSLGVTAMNR